MKRRPSPNPVPSSQSTTWPRWRVAMIRMWAGLLTAYMLLMAHGVLIIGTVAPDERFMAGSSTVWKLLSLGGAVFVLWSGGRNVAGYWAIATGQLVWVVAGILEPQADGNGPMLTLINLLLFYGPLVALRPHRRDLLHPRFEWSPVLLASTLVASVPLVLFAVTLARRLDGDIGFDMVGLYLILAAMALLASGRPRGGHALAPIVGVAAVLTGLAAILLPDDIASAGQVGGALLVAFGAAFTTAAVWTHRGDRVSARPVGNLPSDSQRQSRVPSPLGSIPAESGPLPLASGHPGGVI